MFRVVVLATLTLAAASAATRPLIMGRNGAVVSGHHLASQAGLDMLRRGGNAVDAGVATVFAQSVLEFDRFGIGGEVPILIYLAEEQKVIAINGNGNAPMAATVEWFRQKGIQEIPGDGLLPACVPAVVDSLILALDEYGTLTLADVLAPAINAAEEGFPIHGELQAHIADIADRMRSEWPTSGKIFLNNGQTPAVGDVLVQTDLANLLKRLVEAEARAKDQGRSGALQAARDRFYRGDIAQEAVAFQRDNEFIDANGTVSSGLLTEEDFAAYRARVQEPAATTYRGIEVYKVGFWSQGPVLLQTLNLLETYDIAQLRHNSAEYIHLLAEAMKLSYADREWYYADPDFVGVPASGLLSKAYAAERRKLIDFETPSLELRPGNPYPFDATTTAHAAIPETVALRPDPPGTTGTRTADRHGNVFSATPSGGWFITSPIIDGLGFVFGTRGQAFYLDPDRANALEPGKQPRTTLTPSLALKDGKPILAWGTPGGDVQDQVNLQVFLNIVEFGMDPQEATDAPMFQILDFPPSFFPRTSAPGVMRIESRVSRSLVEALEAKGHTVRSAGPWSLGDCTALMIDHDRGIYLGAAGPRRGKSYALAY